MTLEIHLRIPEIPTEQSATHEESKRTSSIGNISRTMAGNYHQYYWTITKIK